MKVFCIGLSRTGTTSICEALNDLGIKTKHFVPELFVNQQHLSDSLFFVPRINLNFYWHRIRESEIKVYKSKNIAECLDEFNAFGDLPIPLFYKELDAMYPGSKFIYTYRNIDKWLLSMKWLLTDGQVLWKSGFVNEEIRLACYDTIKFDKVKLQEAFIRHHEGVISYFKTRPEDILMINIDEEMVTFAKLCRFLSLPLIDKPFPSSNRPSSVSLYDKFIYYMSKNFIPYSIITKGYSRLVKRFKI